MYVFTTMRIKQTIEVTLTESLNLLELSLEL